MYTVNKAFQRARKMCGYLDIHFFAVKGILGSSFIGKYVYV